MEVIASQPSKQALQGQVDGKAFGLASQVMDAAMHERVQQMPGHLLKIRQYLMRGRGHVWADRFANLLDHLAGRGKMLRGLLTPQGGRSIELLDGHKRGDR